jgi:MoxR-like ATPase
MWKLLRIEPGKHAPTVSSPRSTFRAKSRSVVQPVTIPTLSGLGHFVGQQAQLVYDGLRRGKTVLLAGQTGTGKTLAVEEVAQQMPDARLVGIKGKEGRLDCEGSP